jgi:murein tripeptide amidase MpaA
MVITKYNLLHLAPTHHHSLENMFRNKYLDYSELVRQVERWAGEYPAFVRVASLGTSAEGRTIPLMTIGPRPDEARPAVWVDGNMHASELCGSSVALAIAEEVISLHAGKPMGSMAKLPAHMQEALKETLFYIVPRMSPDGADMS